MDPETTGSNTGKRQGEFAESRWREITSIRCAAEAKSYSAEWSKRIQSPDSSNFFFLNHQLHDVFEYIGIVSRKKLETIRKLTKKQKRRKTI